MTLLGFDVSRRHLLIGGFSLAALAVVAASPQLLGHQVAAGFDGLDSATPVWLWTGALAFVAALTSAGWAWRSALGCCGARICHGDAAARYAVGSLVNSLTPAKIGTAVRLALYSRAVEGEGRVWTTSGVGAVIGAAQAFWLTALVAIATVAGVLPLWPLAALLGIVGVTGLAMVVAARWRPSARIGHLLDAFRALDSSPRSALVILAWMGLGMAGRLGAAASVCAAFGVRNPIAAAFLIIPAVDLAATLPLTPGNLGVASAAVAVALKAHGVTAAMAMSIGIGFSAVETSASLAFGTASVLYLAARVPGARRWTFAVAAAAGCAALAGAFSFTVLVPLA
jgi:uncharacterized membrane protein YbhN (UPF0104 family)